MPRSIAHNGASPAAHRRSLMFVAAVAVALVAVIGLALFQPWKLWIDDQVNEATPVGAVPITAVPTSAPAAPPTTATAPDPTSTTPRTEATPTTTVTSTSLSSHQSAPPVSTAVSPQTVAPASLGGQFVGIDHGTSGAVVLLEDATGSRFVRLQDLDTSNGPDLFVYLSTNPPDGPESEFDDDYVNLGRLEGNVGSSNYPIPAGTDLSRYASVVIWCDRFDSAFGAARLR